MTHFDPNGFFGNGDMGGMAQTQAVPDYSIQSGTDAAPQFADWGQGGVTADDPNYGIYQQMQNQQQPVNGQYGYDGSLNQNMSAADVNAFFNPTPQQNQPQFQQPQFQQLQYQQPQFQPGNPQQAYQGMYPQPQQQPGYPQNFNPAFGQPNTGMQTLMQPQGQPQQAPLAVSPEQFFQGAVPPMQPPAGYPQNYQQPTMQPGQQTPPLPGYPTADYGFGPQAWQQPQFQQPQYQPQYQQPQQNDPTTAIQGEIEKLEERIAANQLALNSATNLNDQDSMVQLARENARLSGQLTAAYVRQQSVSESYANSQLASVRSDYTRNMTQMLQTYFGYTPQQSDLMEFQYMLDMIATPETAASLQTPAVRDMVLKSYAFDKMTRVQGRGGRPQPAPRDYVPTMGGVGMGVNNFGQGQQRNASVGFDGLTERQRTQFLMTGQIPR